ncbi:MAG: rhodanese-like domain-containing protein [Planctomycetota bacterium]
MYFKQFYLGCLAHASYLIADEAAGEAAIVDPQRDIEQYLEEAKRLGVEIRHVLLTHFHADFLAGHLELREKTGARLYLGAKAEAEYDFQPLADGDRIDFGKVRIQALATPGHTPESTSYLVYDLEKDAVKPHAVLTGDTLFIGDVGRPDLMASIGITAEELASMLYDSLHEKLLKLPDETLVYPAHGAGSLCGKSLSSETFSTLGQQRQMNYALQPMSREKFIEMSTSNLPDAPAYFGYDAMLNRQERATLGETLEKALQPLKLDAVLRLQNSGAQVLDVRSEDDFTQGSLQGAVHVGLGGKYATWAGTVLATDRSIVILADPGKEQEAAMRLGRIGFDKIAGFVEGGPKALEDRPELVRRFERIDVDALRTRLEGPNPPRVLDVRSPGEFEGGHIEGAINVPLNRLEKNFSEVPKGQELAVICGSGYRSTIAVSLLANHGFESLLDIRGGMSAWGEKTACATK